MSDNTMDVRTKICERDHAVLTAVSLASGKEIAVIVRELIASLVESEVHRATVVTNVLRREGISGSTGE